LIEIVDSETSCDGVYEYCVGRGGGGEDIGDVDFEEIAVPQDWLVVRVAYLYLFMGLVHEIQSGRRSYKEQKDA
jgi:hypothetical protein